MPTRPISLDRRINGARRRRGPSSHADATYGLLYPPNHLRLVDFRGDPEDITRGLLTFDRDLGAMPGDVNLWCGDKKAFYPTQVNARVVRVSFNCPIYTSTAWTIDPSLGGFRGADGCAEALAASGLLQWAGGPHPSGKIWLVGISRYDSTTLDFTFNQAATSTGDVSGLWCSDEWGNTQSGTSVWQPASEILRVSFPSNVGPTPMKAGIVAGFTGIYEYADLLSPITWRI